MHDLSDKVKQFHSDGFVFMSNVLNEDQINLLNTGVEEAFRGPRNGYAPIFRGMMFERGEVFENLIDLPPVINLVEAILGDNCHLRSMNAIKTPRRTGIDQWHIDLIDDEMFFPLPKNVDWDNNIQMPVFIVNCLYYLADVEEDMGPTQLVPGSHRSGKFPDTKQELPVYNGKKPVTFKAKAGDCLIFNNQVWHRGGLNLNQKPRIVQQVVYSKSYISHSFYPLLNYRVPEHVLARADNRRKRLIGFHKVGLV
ncbi:phytanoyl-CoA dioxygenase family protein [Bacillus cereus]|uniref:phytanoyl-CoA dioxygenase family protein n=1 Tax=Bacillus cereus TaxID=1396 RepID=UPI001FFCBB49|nr:phytanoyl-CoA dioxygenase family protein [Bacillus cereus]UPJ18351.1 phytanoyl-CoA dioxygenase family protein [Bacillus cereus]